MNESAKPKAAFLAKQAIDAVVRKKNERDAAIASGEIDPPRAAALARDVVKIVAPGQEERLLALLAMLSEVSLGEMKSMSLGKIADLVEAAAREEGREDFKISLATPSRHAIPWRDATDADREPLYNALHDLFGGYVAAAESAPAQVAPAEAEAEPAGEIDYVPVAASVMVRLRHPFRLDGTMIRTITLHPPRFGDVQAVSAGKLERTAMIAEMAGLSVAAINALRWPDAERVVGIAMDMAPEYIGG